MVFFQFESLLLSTLLIATQWMTKVDGRCIMPDKDQLDFSDRNLTGVPSDLPRSTQYLDLSYNHISSLKSGDLANMPALCIFKITNCGLTSLSPQTFQENPLLQELDLSFNDLLTVPVLQGLTKLQVVDLSENLYDSIRLDESYGTLESLTSISLGGPRVSHEGNLDLRPLSRSPLQELKLRVGDDLVYFPTDFLDYLSELKSLTLQVNFCDSPKLFRDVLQSLHSSTVDSLTLNNFLPEFCVSAANLTDDLKALGRLKHLTMINPFFHSSILPQAMVNILQSQLQTITVLNCTYVEDTPEGLVIMSVPDYSKIGNLRVITVKTVHHHQHTYLKSQFNVSLIEGLVKAEWTGFGWNGPNNMLGGYIGDISTLQTLDISHNNLECSSLANKIPFKFMTSLRELIIRNNKIQSLETVAGYAHLFVHLQVLDLSFNPIKLSPHRKVNWPKHLKNLSLSGNLLGNQLFDHLSVHFVSVNLTQTDITTVNTNELERMKNLQQLFLGYNAIRELPANLTLPQLEELHVERNSISTFRAETFQGLPKLRKLNGGHNPFVCDCNLYWFLMDFNKSVLEDWPEAYSCNFPANLKGTPLEDYHPSKVLCNPPVLFGISFSAILFIMVSFSIIFYAVDGAWYVKMLWTWIRVKRRSWKKYQRLTGAEFTYHAFVSFSERDGEWVRSELVPHLEAVNFSLCIHDRDFEPGEWVIANIIKCVERSYKTLFVLSQSFVQSEWCNYELFFAQQRAISVSEDSLVFVLLEPIPYSSLSRKFLRLRSFLRQRTYLQWPSEEDEQRLFWLKLTDLLMTADTNVLRQVSEGIADICHGDNVCP